MEECNWDFVFIELAKRTGWISIIGRFVFSEIANRTGWNSVIGSFVFNE
jgi:hypothetical protein